MVSKDHLNVGVFWDIENVSIPKNCPPDSIVSTIRSKIIKPNGLQERDFYCVCNVSMISSSVGQSLESIGVTMVQPFYDEAKNAADTKILTLISKFIKNWGTSGCTIVVVTGDSDFCDPLLKLKLNHDLTVVLIHGKRSFSKDLLWCADETYQLSGSVLKETTPNAHLRGSLCSTFIKIFGFPSDADSHNRINEINRACLRISGNCRVVDTAKGTVWIGFLNPVQRMTEKEMELLTGLKFIGVSPKLELVNNLRPRGRHKQRADLAHNFDNGLTPASTSRQSFNSNQISIGIKSSITVESNKIPNHRQWSKSRQDGSPSVSLRISGPWNGGKSAIKKLPTTKSSNFQSNQVPDKKEINVRLPKMSIT